MSDTKKSSPLKLIIVILFLIGALVFVYAQYKGSRPSPSPETRRGPDARRPGRPDSAASQPRPMRRPPTPEERAKRREEMDKQLDLTPEQRTKVDEINKRFEGKSGREVGRERMEAFSEVLTDEQRGKMRSLRGQRRRGREERMRRRVLRDAQVLPENEREKLREKLEQRLEQRGQRRGERGRPPRGGR